MQLNPYLMFAGDCEAAFRFYQQCLGGELEEMLRYGDSPVCDEVSPQWRDKIAHVRLAIGDNTLMGSDAPSGERATPQGFSVTLTMRDAEEAERIFSALADGGRIEMPLEETFWAVRFGTLVDRFSIPWMINCIKIER